MVFCIHCGTENLEIAKFCKKCGKEIDPVQVQPEVQSMTDPNVVGKTCPYCQAPIKQGADIVECPACGMPHHRECWTENGNKCTTFGCDGSVIGHKMAKNTYAEDVPRSIPTSEPSSTPRYCYTGSNYNFFGLCFNKLGNIPHYNDSVADAADPYAGFWVRAWALIIDVFIIIQFGGLVVLFLFLLNLPSEDVLILLFPIIVFLGIGYYVYLESSRNMMTFGKRILGLKVVNESGAKISVRQSFIRCISKFLSFFIIGIGFIMTGFTKKKQTLHDKIARTYVVYK